MNNNRDLMSRRDVLRNSLLLGSSASLWTTTTSATSATSDGPAFYDDWEDGDYQSDPGWNVNPNEGNFRARVKSQSTPQGGNRILQIRETTGGGTTGGVIWAQGRSGWDGEWTLRGQFYTQNVPLNSDFQGHRVKMYHDGGTTQLTSSLGFVDSNGHTKPFSIRGELIDSVESQIVPGWKEDAWYNYEISHDGNGTYVGRLWEEGSGRPSTPDAKSVGRSPGTDERSASLQINGAHWQPFEMNHSFMEWRGGFAGGGSGGALQDLIDQKSEKIDAIRSLAGQTTGVDDATSTVDQVADSLLGDISDDTLGASDQQYRRALNRMNAAESVTEASTRAVVGEDNPTEKTAENIYSFVTGAAIELLPEIGEKIGAGILKRVNASIIDDVASYLDDLVQGVRGNGALPTSSLNDIDDELNAYKISQSSRTESAIRNNRETARDAVKSSAGGSLKATQLIAEATNPNAKQNLLDGLEEILFDAYYFAPDVPAVDVPVPQDIDLPDLNISYDVPDEELPSYLRGGVPDKIEISSGDLEIPLTESPALQNISALLDTYHEDVRRGGINTTIDARMEALESELSTLSEQDGETRGEIKTIASDAIDAVETLLNDILIDGLEEVSKVLSLAGDLASAGVGAALVGAAFLIVTGFGAATALGLAGTLATVATALSVATLIIDSVQIVSGFGFAMADNKIHQTATYLLAESDLTGVNL